MGKDVKIRVTERVCAHYEHVNQAPGRTNDSVRSGCDAPATTALGWYLFTKLELDEYVGGK